MSVFILCRQCRWSWTGDDVFAGMGALDDHACVHVLVGINHGDYGFQRGCRCDTCRTDHAAATKRNRPSTRDGRRSLGWRVSPLVHDGG